MTWVTFLWQHFCCYGKICVNIKRCCQTTCLHWDIRTLEDGKSAKIFYMVRKRNVWLIIVLLRKRPWEIQLYPVYTPPFMRQYRARAKTSERHFQILEKLLKMQMVLQEVFIIAGIWAYPQKGRHSSEIYVFLPQLYVRNNADFTELAYY